MEIVPKPPRRIPTFERILFFLSLFLFLFTIFSFIFFFFSVNKLNSKKVELEKKISELETPEIKRMKEELSQMEDRFLEIENLLNSHVFSSHFFPFLESQILKNIVLTSLNLNVSGKQAKVSGIAENFVALSKQYFLFKQSPKIEKAQITSVSITPEGKIGFEISFSFKDEVIK